MTVTAALQSPITLLDPAFAQRALVAVLIVAVIAAALGWAIVLRDLPFFTHAVGAGAYPVLVLGVIAGVSIAVSALVGALVFALCLGAVAGVGRARGASTSAGHRDALTGLAVAAALAAGAVLAARAGSGDSRLAISPEALLFGSLLTIDSATLIVLAIAAAVVVVTAWLVGGRWLAGGFDPAVAGQFRSSRADVLLLGCVAIGAAATLPVTGSLLTGALLIIPAATARMLTDRANRLPLLVFSLAAFEGVLGLYISLNFDLPTGASIAFVAGAGFFLTAGAVLIARSRSAARPSVALALVALMAIGAAGCGEGSTSAKTASDGKINVVATTPQIADIVRNVGGDAVDVTTLLPIGADPHDYEPRPKAVTAISKADVVFRSGGDIDAWLLPAVKAAGADAAPVDLSRSVVLRPGGTSGAKSINAHWYLSPANVSRAAQRVRDALIKADPDARETLRTNTTQYLDEIDAVNTKLLSCTSNIPADSRNLLAGHNDFNYLADAFEFDIAAQIAQSGESEPSASELQAAVDQARNSRVRAVVASRGEATRLDQQVADKIGVPLLQLYADSLTTGDDGSTLLGAIGFDVGSIASAVTKGDVKCPSTD
jgi:ABC-type Zn uptake system ZnuABC Zn-binding protein ZnuA/ABC-type Mn2+/Zn2+ transport system permease subunit